MPWIHTIHSARVNAGDFGRPRCQKGPNNMMGCSKVHVPFVWSKVQGAWDL